MDLGGAPPAAAMLPPKNCLPRNYSCIAGLFGGGLADANPRSEDGDESDLTMGACAPMEGPVVVDERPRGREVFLKPPQSPSLRRRCKSLPTHTARARLEEPRSRSPTSQKRVRFADSLGLELFSVKHFDDTDVPEVPEGPEVPEVAQRPPHLQSSATRFPRPPPRSVLMELQFTPPASVPGFEQRLREGKVLLENVTVDELNLSGFVRVLNLAFEKRVTLRYSVNNWTTFSDTPASYVPDSSDGLTDRFHFKVAIPAYLESGGTLQFAVRYCVGGQEFWDNNDGNNYKVRRQSYNMSPPREWDSGWIHFI